jgi:translation initiation factor 2 beta subunit (eIF-2beta)/eIF-5
MMRDHSPAEMKEHVEERIKSLHSKLMITREQEPEWNDVAQAMRDSEASVSMLIKERHENSGSMNAVDDLESYQAIAEAHAEGLAKVNEAFKVLYTNMSPEQQKNADKVFGSYEGHGEPEHHKHHGHHGQPKAAK